MKIIHISDLHFCTPELKQILGIITDSIKKQFSYDLEIDYHDNEIAQVLQRLIQKVDPDIILITGDITTFGDEQSFALAYEWIRPLLARSNGKAERECVILPGNHDVLQGQFAYLLQKMPFYWRGVVKLRYWEIYKQIKNVVGEIKINSPSDIFTNFNRFAKSNHGLFSDRLEKNIDDEQKLIIHPFQSVSTNPI